MKSIFRYIVVAVASVATVGVYAQKSKVEIKPNVNDWINERVEGEVFGLGLNDAYNFIIKNRLKAKNKPIVAVICAGVDVEHEAIKDNVWVNKKEKANGKDDDGNGLIDDINGWNFISSRDGKFMDITLSEGNREYLRLRSKFDGLSKDDKGFYRYKDNDVKRYYVDENIDIKEWEYFVNKVRPESSIARSYGGYTFAYTLREFAHKFNNELKAKFPDAKDFTLTQLAQTCWDKNGPQDEVQNACMYLMAMYGSISKTDSWNKVFEQYGGDKQLKLAYGSSCKDLENEGNDGRGEIVGDNFLDINDKIYGSNAILTANSAAGTMVAGLIAGKRSVEGRNNPIAENARIMTLVVSGKKGEPYLKDMALAIRYAVDNGASVITLPQQNTLYPELGKKWIADALLYAESKNVMVIVPTWELSQDIDKVEFLPHRAMVEGKTLTNLLVVSPSNKNGTPKLNSNYGLKSVDLYAPAENIFSTHLGDTYLSGSGTLFSAATTAGVVALIKTYFPNLSNGQIREILISSCTSRKGVEVEKGIQINGNTTQDLYLFDQLCVSGGILNAYNAIVEASKVSDKK